MSSPKIDNLKAPFPYFGGKTAVADMVWSRLGNVDNYIEPFAGSLAVLLRRPAWHFHGHKYRAETCNDINHYIVNFWRAVKGDPDQVAYWADHPISEADLHARHKWLMRSETAKRWRQLMTEDPEHYNAKMAGWWVWGQSCWIGREWCNETGPGQGQDSSHLQSIPHLDRPLGVNASPFDIDRGVNTSMGNSKGSVCDDRRELLIAWMRRLADRLRWVRICYGSWRRVCDSFTTTTRLDEGNGVGVFLDPPYPTRREDNRAKSRKATLYASDHWVDLDVLRDEVRDWCIKWGEMPGVRIVVCGYEGDGYETLAAAHGWEEVKWKAHGGYANQGAKKRARLKAELAPENRERERIWFSPQCKRDASLF